MLLEGRFENPPVIKKWEGGPEPHTPGTGRAAGPRARGQREAAQQPWFAGSQKECSLISWKPRPVEAANICTEAGRVPRNQDRGLKLDKVQPCRAGAW